MTDFSAALDNFDEDASAYGVFQRYCRSRSRFFLLRIFVMATTGISIAVLMSPIFGLAVFMLVASGDAVDTTFLHLASARAHQIDALPKRRHAALGTTACQSATISIALIATWILGGPPTHFFSLVMVTSAAIDASMAVYYYRTATRIKLILYVTAMVAIFVIDFALKITPTTILAVDLGAALVLGLVISRLLKFLYNYQGSYRKNMRQLLVAERDANVSGAALDEKRKEAQHLALVAKNVNDGIVISKPNAEITWVNSTFTKITGYSFEEAVGRKAGDVLNGPWTSDAALKKIYSVSMNLRPVRVEIENRSKSGKRLWLEASITPVFDKDGKHILNIGVERDISVAKASALALAKAKIDAEEALKAKSQFLATMSHELRTPMNGIVGMSDMLSHTILCKDQSLYVKTITESGNALLNIIEDILNFSRLESGKSKLQKSTICLNDILSAIFNLLEPTAQKKGLELILLRPLETMPAMIGDSGRIRQIIVNLVGNAIKFTESGGVSIAVVWAAVPTGLEIKIAVKDTGIGIPKDQRSRVFDAFTQVDSQTTRKVNGTGLGLSISKSLAIQMGGDITLGARDGGGSVFEFSAILPKAVAAETEDMPRKAPTKKLPKGLKILVAEDNVTNQFILRKMLEFQKVEVVIANNGSEVIDIYCSQATDVILMDVSMPVIDGIEATRKIRDYELAHQKPATPIVALTANAFEADKKTCFAAGMTGFLTKPILQNNLIAEIASQLDLREP